jgi:FMN phosphatase YigB (HAD superfamily)
MKGYYFDVDGVLANFHKEKFEYKKAINREWIANLEPFVENVELVRTLILRGEKVFIISKAASENARLGKLDWFKKHLPELVEENIFVIVGHGNKADYIQTEEAILFDDDMKNCRQWAKACQTYYHLEIKGEKIIF